MIVRPLGRIQAGSLRSMTTASNRDRGGPVGFVEVEEVHGVRLPMPSSQASVRSRMRAEYTERVTGQSDGKDPQFADL